MSRPRKKLYRFSRFCLNPSKHSVDDQGRRDITPKAVDTLVILIEQRRRVMSKDEIRAAVWGTGVHVEPNSVERQISDLRKALGDGPDGQSHIETIPRRGYRFRTSVEESWDETGAAAVEQPAAEVRPVDAVPAVPLPPALSAPCYAGPIIRWRFLPPSLVCRLSFSALLR